MANNQQQLPAEPDQVKDTLSDSDTTEVPTVSSEVETPAQPTSDGAASAYSVTVIAARPIIATTAADGNGRIPHPVAVDMIIEIKTIPCHNNPVADSDSSTASKPETARKVKDKTGTPEVNSEADTDVGDSGTSTEVDSPDSTKKNLMKSTSNVNDSSVCQGISSEPIPGECVVEIRDPRETLLRTVWTPDELVSNEDNGPVDNSARQEKLSEPICNGNHAKTDSFGENVTNESIPGRVENGATSMTVEENDSVSHSEHAEVGTSIDANPKHVMSSSSNEITNPSKSNVQVGMKDASTETEVQVESVLNPEHAEEFASNEAEKQCESNPESNAKAGSNEAEKLVESTPDDLAEDSTSQLEKQAVSNLEREAEVASNETKEPSESNLEYDTEGVSSEMEKPTETNLENAGASSEKENRTKSISNPK